MKIRYFQVGDKKFTLKAMQLFSRLRDGWVHKQIGEDFGISKGTIDHRVPEIFHKAGFKNATEMVAFLVDHGLEPNGYFQRKNLFKPGWKKAYEKPISPKKK